MTTQSGTDRPATEPLALDILMLVAEHMKHECKRLRDATGYWDSIDGPELINLKQHLISTYAKASGVLKYIEELEEWVQGIDREQYEKWYYSESV